MINYFSFKKFEDKYLITNDFGKYSFLEPSDFWNLILLKGDVGKETIKNELSEVEKHFLESVKETQKQIEKKAKDSKK